MDLQAHLIRQIVFSRATFGPGERTGGVTDHITKELGEVAKETETGGPVKEWTDVVILGFDGLWRSAEAHLTELQDGRPPTVDQIARRVVWEIVAKQGRNELRTWPDWRTAPADKAIEHVRKPSSEGDRFIGKSLDELAAEVRGIPVDQLVDVHNEGN